MQLNGRWPEKGIIHTEGIVTLTWIDDELLGELAELAAEGIFPQPYPSYAFGWARGDAETVWGNVIEYQRGVRTTCGPEEWRLECAVIVDKQPVGVVGIGAREWGERKVAVSGSWLGRRYQGRGIGFAAARGLLRVYFDQLGGQEARRLVYPENTASLRVGEKLGYVRAEDNWFSLTKEQFRARFC